jgi:hypothetical protein
MASEYIPMEELQLKEKEEKEKEDEILVPFWGNNPNILFDQKYMFEFFPMTSMSSNRQLNSITRLVIVLSIFWFFVNQSIRVLFICGLTLGAIWGYYQKTHKKESFSTNSFSSLTQTMFKDQLIPNLFDTPSSTNPMGNVLMGDYDYASEKKPAPPSYTTEAQTNILKQARQMISETNPEQPRMTDKLFKSLEDNLVFEQSMRPFFSNPSTTIPNDQDSFADFCYGSMVSCKEGNQFACARNLARHQL